MPASRERLTHEFRSSAPAPKRPRFQRGDAATLALPSASPAGSAAQPPSRESALAAVVGPMRQLSPVSERISPAKFAHFALRTCQFEKMQPSRHRWIDTRDRDGAHAGTA